MGNEIFAKLQEFIVKETRIKLLKITSDAGLETDLGIYGDDAADLIVAFSKEFNVDISNFIFDNYIGPEGSGPSLDTIIRFFMRRPKIDRKDLKVSHLEKAIIAGRLDEEVING